MMSSRKRCIQAPKFQVQQTQRPILQHRWKAFSGKADPPVLTQKADPPVLTLNIAREWHYSTGKGPYKLC